jgi:cbb3-type cytochrome oxidase maturation protein
VSTLAITIPASLLLAGILLALVLRAVRRGEFDDWEGPSARHFLDDDASPERQAELPYDEPASPDGGR